MKTFMIWATLIILMVNHSNITIAQVPKDFVTQKVRYDNYIAEHNYCSAQIERIQSTSTELTVSLVFTSMRKNAKFEMSSSCFIKDFATNNIIRYVKSTKGFPLNQNTRLYDPMTPIKTDLIFEPLPDGIEIINLEVHSEYDDFVWKGVVIDNPLSNDQKAQLVNELRLMEHYLEDGISPNEGIYELVINADRSKVVRIGIQKANGGLDVFHLSGGHPKVWREGERKAQLSETGVADVYKGWWVNESKGYFDNVHFKFSDGYLEVLLPDGTKEFYLMTYPTKGPESKDMSGTGNQMPLTELFARNKDAVFYVAFPEKTGVSFGSGFFVSSDGVAVSNYHVFKDRQRGSELILLGNGQELKVTEVLESNEEEDYIIFRVKPGVSPYPYVKITKRPVAIGQEVFAIGNPKGLEKSLSNGVVAGIRTESNMIQITAPITHGSSGGPLFNMQGEVIGVTTSGIENSGINFAIDIQRLRLSRFVY